MRQTFTFADSNHKPPQALAALKNRVRKYLKRERRKALPEGVDYWDFDCRVGEDEDSATVAHVAEVIGRMDTVFESGHPTVYIEILAKPGVRQPRG
ncbi:MAG: hypothetical protein KC912_25965 [Proteobacteria bacterium]|nr:hypothetical protein [Pseudomonadota bacterium]